MTIIYSELTREQIREVAPETTVVLPTASIEQHGPHLPVCTDSTLCENVARRAAERASEQVPVLVTPILYYGNSHHHFPFPGVLSLTSRHFMAAVTDVLEGLVKSGFRKLVILNGHGGNTDSNRVVGLDMVNRLDHPVSVAAAAYWDIARPALVEKGLIAGNLVPGHAGQFETALMMAIRPDLVSEEGLAQTRDVSQERSGLFADLTGATVQVHGAWASGPGYTDNPSAATAEQGNAMLEVIVQRVSDFLVAFHRT